MSKAVVKKTSLKKTAAATANTEVLAPVKGYARSVWLAGLGAYVKVGQEGLGYFKSLVKSGEGIENQGKKLFDKQLEAANEQLGSVKVSLVSNVDNVKNQVENKLEKLEKAFDNRVASALNRIGIPSKQDVETLSAKLDVLSALLEHVARTK
ncbi:phasin family protein [Pseudomonas sp. 5P_3.1_Bac2]|uniref:phasin family protein n=1 Tax=Pseudomonas sp. 5P_3.1_Bac2 TaxID=2971617 RepID=UPI0021C8F978|nr:phasin family protein [Pseudomonas sp. 5P_3.1_Bac2]MCU1717854.1 phasin family protein [Pseudomonas sp. 5P_3.1_Bac2]